jgi:hypothetical protein
MSECLRSTFHNTYSAMSSVQDLLPYTDLQTPEYYTTTTSSHLPSAHTRLKRTVSIPRELDQDISNQLHWHLSGTLNPALG